MEENDAKNDGWAIALRNLIITGMQSDKIVLYKSHSLYFFYC